MEDIIQLKISLIGSKPPIWRRILVDKNSTFFQLHQILQIVMGWENTHLHKFLFNERVISNYEEEAESSFSFLEIKVENGINICLSELITNHKSTFTYIYDIGNYWEHKILVEDFLPPNPATQYPICIKGKLNCPPEDCGGIYSFYEMLEILSDSTHPDYKFMRQWLGKNYSPELFDIDRVNKILKKIFKK